MIIGLMSDTHGFVTEMRRVAALMVEKYRAELIIHLGDDSTDADDLLSFGIDVISVPGIHEDRYKNQGIQNRVITNLGGVKFLLTHSPTTTGNDLPDDVDPTEVAKNGSVKVILYGHTHQPLISEKNGATYINPGHLKMDDKRGNPPTFGIMEIKGEKMDVKIIDLNGVVLTEKRVFVG